MATDNVRMTIYVPAEMKRRLQLEALDCSGNDVSAYVRTIIASWHRLNDAVAVTLALQTGDTYDPDRLDAEDVPDEAWRAWPRRTLGPCPHCPDTAKPGCTKCERSRHVVPSTD